MFCRNCQTIIPDDSIFCENCGAPTGLDPDSIDDSNLIPEEAVEYEVIKDEAPMETDPVPVDPVWWEPPEDENEPIDVEITEIFQEEEPLEEAPAAETEPPADGSGTVRDTKEFDADRWKHEFKSEHAPEETGGSEHEEAMLDRMEYDSDAWGKADDLIGPDTEDEEEETSVTEIASEVLHGLTSGILGAGRSLLKKLEREESEEEEAAVEPEAADEEGSFDDEEFFARFEQAVPAEQPGEKEPDERPESFDRPEPFAEEKAFDVPEPFRVPEEIEEVGSIEPRTGGKTRESAEAEPRTGDMTGESAEAEPQTGGGEDPETIEKAEAGDGIDEEIEADTEDGETTEHLTEALSGSLSTLKQKAMSTADQAKPYADKARVWLGELGKNVHTGTGKAWASAREQLLQKKDEYEERRGEREQQKREDRRAKEIREKRKENDRQRELDRQREEERKAREAVIQQPGFWYGDEMPGPSVNTRPRFGSVSDGTADRSDTGSPFGKRENDPESDEAGVWLDEEYIEDKLADTMRFDWKRGDLDAVIAAAAAAEIKTGEGSREGSPAEGGEDTDARIGEEVRPGSDTKNDSEAEADNGAISDAGRQTDGDAPAEGTADTDGIAPTEAGSEEEDDRAVDAGSEIADDSAASVGSDTEPEIEPDAEYDAGPDLKPDTERGYEERPVAIVEEDVPPDEPALYRIRDFGPATGGKRSRGTDPLISRDTLKIIGIIVAILLAIGIVAAVLINQEHMRQLEEEAYQSSLAQAQELAEKDRYSEAEKAYLALIDERPEDTTPYLGLAEMYVEQQRYVDAKALIERAEEATGDEETFKALKKKIRILTSTKWKKEYIRVLKDNEDAIRQYEEEVTASVAVCDVNGDMKPELFFFTREYYGYGKLHIYTTVKNKAREVEYECRNRGTQYSDAFYDVPSCDTSYAIFNSKEKGKFTIYANVDSEGRTWDTINEYKLKKKGKCRHLDVIEGSVDTNYDDEMVDNSIYLRNDEGITYDKYSLAFREMLENVKEVILYSGGDGDQAVWAKVNPDNVMCMSYDTMLTDLRAK